MTKYFLGIDAGGTKTHAAVMDDSGAVVGFAGNGCGNWERVGVAAVMKTLHEVIGDALKQAKVEKRDLSAATFAMAGVDWDSDQTKMSKELEVFGFPITPTVMNDAYAVLYAGTPRGIGCASIAGTGGKTVACDGTQDSSTLGMSLGEGGGAGQLIAEALQILARMQHGQHKRTPLMADVLDLTGFSKPTEFFEAIARDHLSLEESIAPLVFEKAAAGDIAAIEVVEVVARQHAWDVLGLVEKMAFSSPVALVRAGGLHTANSAEFNAAFEDVIASSKVQFDPSILEVPPVSGSLLHAALSCGSALDEKQRHKLFEDSLAKRM
ncbi:MAG: hypothetical protein RL410_981 [Actinomycetota bacterium]|jgi:N-acetylglucosamine kinase-like BadF-type ATPase